MKRDMAENLDEMLHEYTGSLRMDNKQEVLSRLLRDSSKNSSRNFSMARYLRIRAASSKNSSRKVSMARYLRTRSTNGQNAPASGFRMPRRRVLVLALVAALALSLSALAVEQLVSAYRMTAQKHTRLIAGDGEVLDTSIRFLDKTYITPEYEQAWKQSDVRTGELVEFGTIEGAEAVLGFAIEVPSHLPDGYAFLKAKIIQYTNTGLYADFVRTYYGSGDVTGNMVLTKYYIGPDAKLEVDSVYPTEAMTIGGREMICLQIEEGGAWIVWVDGSFAYELRYRDLEAAKKMVESLAHDSADTMNAP